MKTKGNSDNLTSREMRDYYDARFAQRPLRAREGFYEWLARRTVPPEGSRVLDIGCGGGYLLGKLEGRGLKLFGCDLSGEALSTAAREAPDARFAVTDAEKLSYPGGTFDVAYNLGSLEHFLDMKAALEEMRRVLRPEGRAVVMVPNSLYAGDLWRKVTFRGGGDHHQLLERFGSLGEWSELLESGGFRIVKVFPYNKFRRRMRIVPLRYAYCFVFDCAVSEDKD